MIIAKTGLTVAEHQRRTVANYCRLRELAPNLPFVPVLQGWTTADYLRCVQLYDWHGVRLTDAPLVGLGSVCRRQATAEVGAIITDLHDCGVTRLHGFGFKVLGLRRFAHLLRSADSMAWSVAARRAPALPGCAGHRNCANCPHYAHRWRATVLAAISRAGTTAQPALFPLCTGAAA